MSGKHDGFQLSQEKYIFTFGVSGEVTSVAEIESDGRLSYERIDRNETYKHDGDLVIKFEAERGYTEWTAYSDSDRDGLWAQLAEGYGAPSLPLLNTLLKAQTAVSGQIQGAIPSSWGNDDDSEHGGDDDYSSPAWLGSDAGDNHPSPHHDDDHQSDRGSESEQYVFTFGANGTVTSVAEIEENGRLDYERIDRDESYALINNFVVKTEWDDGRAEWTVYADGNGDGRWTEMVEGYGLLDLAGVTSQIDSGFLGLS